MLTPNATPDNGMKTLLILICLYTFLPIQAEELPDSLLKVDTNLSSIIRPVTVTIDAQGVSPVSVLKRLFDDLKINYIFKVKPKETSGEKLSQPSLGDPFLNTNFPVIVSRNVLDIHVSDLPASELFSVLANKCRMKFNVSGSPTRPLIVLVDPAWMSNGSEQFDFRITRKQTPMPEMKSPHSVNEVAIPAP